MKIFRFKIQLHAQENCEVRRAQSEFKVPKYFITTVVVRLFFQNRELSDIRSMMHESMQLQHLQMHY